MAEVPSFDSDKVNVLANDLLAESRKSLGSVSTEISKDLMLDDSTPNLKSVDVVDTLKHRFPKRKKFLLQLKNELLTLEQASNPSEVRATSIRDRILQIGGQEERDAKLLSALANMELLQRYYDKIKEYKGKRQNLDLVVEAGGAALGEVAYKNALSELENFKETVEFEYTGFLYEFDLEKSDYVRKEVTSVDPFKIYKDAEAFVKANLQEALSY